MQQPLKFLPDGPAATAVVAKFAQRGCPVGLSYATVRDYCESVDDLPQIAPTDGDLKNVQRPWTVIGHIHVAELRNRPNTGGD